MWRKGQLARYQCYFYWLIVGFSFPRKSILTWTMAHEKF